MGSGHVYMGPLESHHLRSRHLVFGCNVGVMVEVGGVVFVLISIMYKYLLVIIKSKGRRRYFLFYH